MAFPTGPGRYAEKRPARGSAQTAKRRAARKKSGQEISGSLARLQINCPHQERI